MSVLPALRTRFNPLTGISSILTYESDRSRFTADTSSFNPLTGISSILTQGDYLRDHQIPREFQSPDGDFVYSDALADCTPEQAAMACFNPLTGISSILTQDVGLPVWG